MGVTPSAITQYLNRSTGDAPMEIIMGSDKGMSLVSDISLDLVEGGRPVDVILLKLCVACWTTRKEGLICAHSYSLGLISEEIEPYGF